MVGSDTTLSALEGGSPNGNSRVIAALTHAENTRVGSEASDKVRVEAETREKGHVEAEKAKNDLGETEAAEMAFFELARGKRDTRVGA